MSVTIDLGGIEVTVVRKDIKNLHLSVYPPIGTVRIAAPSRMDLGTIRLFAISKLGWIKSQQRKLREQPREAPREYLERESHFLWGKRYLLQLVEREATPRVEVKHNKMLLQLRPGADETKKRQVLEDWYRERLKEAAPPLIARWEVWMGVTVRHVFVQRMRTKWGSCSPLAGNIRLNTDLAKKPPECLEYIVVHEMAHLLEPTHNGRFQALMDGFMPNWRLCRDELNRLPVRHENWSY
jgi:predicted metal-dependent hydrolase